MTLDMVDTLMTDEISHISLILHAFSPGRAWSK